VSKPNVRSQTKWNFALLETLKLKENQWRGNPAVHISWDTTFPQSALSISLFHGWVWVVLSQSAHREQTQAGFFY